MGKFLSRARWGRVCFVVGLGFAHAFSAQAEVKLTPRLSTRTVCGVGFYRIEVKSSSTDYEVISRSVALGNSVYHASLPELVQRRPTATAAASPLKLEELKTKIPRGALLEPEFPILPENDPAFCAWVQNYQTTYAALAKIDVTSTLFKVPLNTPDASVTRLKATPALRVASTYSSATLPRPGTPTNIQYLIITQDTYRAQANELATYRRAQGFISHVMSVSQLPGYNPQDPEPAECGGDYEKECYFRPSDNVPGLSYSAVGGLLGMRRLTSADVSAAKYVYTPGIVRAYLRRMKTANPNLRAVLLIGDPEVIPQSVYQSGRLYDHRLNEGTDFFYADPFTPLFNAASIRGISTAAITTSFMPCEAENGTITYRQFCPPEEVRKEFVATRDAPDHPVRLALDKIPFYSGGATTAPFPTADRFMAVGRIITQSSLRPKGVDPVVANYIAKLKYWESHLPSKFGTSIYSAGGAETWLYRYDDFTNFYANYGSNSKIYVSADYLNPQLPAGQYDPELAAECPACTYRSPIQITADLATSTHAAWEIVGHGGRPGVQGPQNSQPADGGPRPPTHFMAHGYYFIDFFGYVAGRGWLQTWNNSSNALTSALGTGNKLIGHVFANSCELNTFHRFNEAFDQRMKTEHPDLNQTSWAETLIGLPNGGAVNTYLNNNVGWSFSDNQHNRNFATAVHTAWQTCGRIGDALTGMLADGSAFANRFATMNRILLGDPLAKIAAPYRGCLPPILLSEETK